MFRKLLSRFFIFTLILTVSLAIVPEIYAAPVDPGSTACDNMTKDGLNLGKCFKLNDRQSVMDVYKSPAFLINLIVKNLFVIAGILFFITILIVGLKTIGGGPKGLEEGQKILETAILGFILMFAAYWIVQIIKVVTGADINF
jgi:hypothetical protein